MRIATAKELLAQSSGRVRTPYTINYRTFEPELDGLWCTRIFGSTDAERARRFGHIELPVPVLHPFAYGANRDRAASTLDLPPRDVAGLARWTHARVVDAGASTLQCGDVLNARELGEALFEHGPFEAKVGAFAIEHALASRGDELLLRVVPVLPPKLRPMIQLDEGRFQTHPLTDLYRRVVNRANRVQRLFELRAPDVVVHEEAKMLQEGVNALFDNGYHAPTITDPEGRALPSLRDRYEGTLEGTLDDDVLAMSLPRCVWTDALALR